MSGHGDCGHRWEQRSSYWDGHLCLRDVGHDGLHKCCCGHEGDGPMKAYIEFVTGELR